MSVADLGRKIRGGSAPLEERKTMGTRFDEFNCQDKNSDSVL